MEKLIFEIDGEHMFMFIGAMTLVVLLFIVLVVVISNLKIKTYRDVFENIQADSQEKSYEITTLQSELETVKIKNAQYEQELEQFSQTKDKLTNTEETLVSLRNRHIELEKLESQTKVKFENIHSMYEKLLKEYKDIKENFELLSEKNTKLRINNARLLIKLEREESLSPSVNKYSTNNKKES